MPRLRPRRALAKHLRKLLESDTDRPNLAVLHEPAAEPRQDKDGADALCTPKPWLDLGGILTTEVANEMTVNLDAHGISAVGIRRLAYQLADGHDLAVHGAHAQGGDESGEGLQIMRFANNTQHLAFARLRAQTESSRPKLCVPVALRRLERKRRSLGIRRLDRVSLRGRD